MVLGGENNASAVLTDLTDAVKDGNAQRVTFNFSETGEVGLRAFVVPAEHYFEKWGPSDIPEAPAASASPSGSVSGSPSASTSGTPSTGEGTAEEEGAAMRLDGLPVHLGLRGDHAATEARTPAPKGGTPPRGAALRRTAMARPPVYGSNL